MGAPTAPLAWERSTCERKVRTLRADMPPKAISASRISPVRGSTWLGPMAPNEGSAFIIQRTEG